MRARMRISRRRRKVRFPPSDYPSYLQPAALAATQSPSPPKVGESSARLSYERVFIPLAAKHKAHALKKRRVIESDDDEARERE